MKSSDDAVILSMLANGVDPETGECLREDRILLRPAVIRALFNGSSALVGQGLKDVRINRGDRPRPKKFENAGAPWTLEQEITLRELWADNSPRAYMRIVMKRSDSALGARLVHLGVIRESEEYFQREDTRLGRPTS